MSEEVTGSKYWTSVVVGSSAAILGIILMKKFYENYYRGKFPYFKNMKKENKPLQKHQQQKIEQQSVPLPVNNIVETELVKEDKIPDLTKERVELIYSKWFGKRLGKTLIHNHKASISKEELGNTPKKWFTKDKEFDTELRELEPILQDLVGNALPLFDNIIDQHSVEIENAWQSSPEAILASIILLDQLPRNIYRNTAKQFSFDPIALRLAKRAIARGVDLQLHPLERVFVYLPLEHAENIKEQNTCLMLCKELAQDEICKRDNISEFIETVKRYSESHLKIIERYGRFPYRNELLQRKSTEEEEEFLKTGETFL